MGVNDVYVLMLDICSKNLQQGYLSPADFNTYINQGQRAYTDYLLGEYQRYQLQRPIAPVQFGQNERIRQSISPLIYGTILSPDMTTGVAPFPSDYEYDDAMWDVYNLYNIRFIQQDRQDSYIHSSIDPVATNPVYLINHEGFLFFPHNIGQAKMSYVRTPPPITWGYTLDGNGIPSYNPLTSQDPVWADTDILEILVRALEYAGVQLQFNTVLQYANNIKEKGQ